MVQNYDMKTWVAKALASNAAAGATQSTNIGSGIIPTGMKRFVTYIRANKVIATAVATACHIYLAEVSTSKPTSASALAATNMKYLLSFPSAVPTASGAVRPVSEIEIGQPGSPNPILSIAGGTFAGVAASGGPVTDMVVQYYDE